MWTSFLNGLKHTAITLAVLIVGGIISALGNFHPTDQVSVAVWGFGGSLVIGALTAVVHWLQNKDTVK